MNCEATRARNYAAVPVAFDHIVCDNDHIRFQHIRFVRKGSAMRMISRQTCLSIAAAVLLAVPMASQAQDFTYTTNADNTITITEYIGAGGDVSIPDTLSALSVTTIGDNAFESCFSLTSVIIPNSVTNIEDWAFNGCYGLTNATIPVSIVNIGEGAFQSSGLTSVTIPNGVTYIAFTSFGYCESLTNVVIGNSVTNIGDSAFQQCLALVNVVIGNSVIVLAGMHLAVATT
jgi:hypothetical protein